MDPGTTPASHSAVGPELPPAPAPPAPPAAPSRHRLGQHVVGSGGDDAGAVLSGGPVARDAPPPAPMPTPSSGLPPQPSQRKGAAARAPAKGTTTRKKKPAATSPSHASPPAPFSPLVAAPASFAPLAGPMPVATMSNLDPQQVFGEMPNSDGAINFQSSPMLVPSFMSMMDELVGLEDEAEIEELEEFYASQASKKRSRQANYTNDEDEALVLAWETVTLDAVTENDQSGAKYWKRIEQSYNQNMKTPSQRSLKSLTNRWSTILESCNRWAGCLEQVKDTPPSGATIDEYDKYAQERYKQIVKSKGKPFVLQHCWKLLENNEKWKMMNDEAPPKKPRSSTSSSPEIEDDDDDCDENERRPRSPTAGSSKGQPDGRKRAKEMLMRDGEIARVRDKIDELITAKKEMAAQAMQAKLDLAEKKQQEKLARWREMNENERRKADIEERRLLLEENRLRQEMVAEENQPMMMDPNGMDEKARAFWEMRRSKILQSRMAWSDAHLGGGSGTGDM